jgi:hypothetical protein
MHSSCGCRCWGAAAWGARGLLAAGRPPLPPAARTWRVQLAAHYQRQRLQPVQQLVAVVAQHQPRRVVPCGGGDGTVSSGGGAGQRPRSPPPRQPGSQVALLDLSTPPKTPFVLTDAAASLN